MTDNADDEDLSASRFEMQAGLVRSVFSLLILAGGGLLLRETAVGGPVLPAAIALGLGIGALVLARLRPAWQRTLGLACCVLMVALITRAALDLGGAAGSALCFGFVPGFIACLVLGPVWGWGVTGLMLACFAALCATTPLPSKSDLLRFTDEVAMTVFAAGLAHALSRSLLAYEDAMTARRARLAALRVRREALAQAIYEQLDPLATRLVTLLDGAPNAETRPELKQTLGALVDSLRSAKALAQRDEVEASAPADPDAAIRRAAMRVWLRLAAVLMTFFVLRNLLAGTAFVPSFFTLAICLAFDLWLGRPQSGRHLELTALALGCAATGPMIAHIIAYGPTPAAPPLVVTPGTVMFTALLGEGLAPWAVLGLNAGILVWVGHGRHLSLTESRLLGDLALSFVAVTLALRCVLVLRGRYHRVLLEQGRALGVALQQQRRLAGTLFHDVSNHLQALVFHFELGEPALEAAQARSLGRRIQRLIELSQRFLLGTRTSDPELRLVIVGEALSSLREIFAFRLHGKGLTLAAGAGMDLGVRAEPDLLVESVLGNLLSNAIKFAAPGSQIDFSAKRTGELVCVVVSDRGPGIPKGVLERLGTDGPVPSEAGTVGEQGQGYGLQLVKEHLARMGGRLELCERAGGGTEAEVWLPAS